MAKQESIKTLTRIYLKSGSSLDNCAVYIARRHFKCFEKALLVSSYSRFTNSTLVDRRLADLQLEIWQLQSLLKGGNHYHLKNKQEITRLLLGK